MRAAAAEWRNRQRRPDTFSFKMSLTSCSFQCETFTGLHVIACYEVECSPTDLCVAKLRVDPIVLDLHGSAGATHIVIPDEIASQGNSIMVEVSLPGDTAVADAIGRWASF